MKNFAKSVVFVLCAIVFSAAQASEDSNKCHGFAEHLVQQGLASAKNAFRFEGDPKEICSYEIENAVHKVSRTKYGFEKVGYDLVFYALGNEADKVRISDVIFAGSIYQVAGKDVYLVEVGVEGMKMGERKFAVFPSVEEAVKARNEISMLVRQNDTFMTASL